MRYQADYYKRLGAMTGSMIGIVLMLVAICMGKNLAGAVLLVSCSCIGLIVGIIFEKKHGEK